MSEFELSDKAKEEFLNLPHIKGNFINCYFEGQQLVIPSGQGKTVKGIVLCSLETFKLQQSKIENQQKWIDTTLAKLDALSNQKWSEWKTQADMYAQGQSDAYEHSRLILEQHLKGSK